MIHWSTVAPALKTLFSNIALAAAVTPEFRAQWYNGAREHVHPHVQMELTLRVTRVADVHTERRYVETADAFVEQLFGMREFTLEVRVSSHEHRESESEWAWSVIERIRTALLFQRSIDALLAVNVGLVSVSDSRDISFKFDKHIVNAAMFEATFNAAFTLNDSVPANWFETILLTSSFTDLAGNALPTPPNVEDYEVAIGQQDEGGNDDETGDGDG